MKLKKDRNCMGYPIYPNMGGMPMPLPMYPNMTEYYGNNNEYNDLNQIMNKLNKTMKNSTFEYVYYFILLL